MELTIEEAIREALALQNNNRIDEAKTLYKKILIASPKHPIAHYNIATLLMQKQEFIEASIHLNIAIDQNKKTTQIWYALALTHFLLKEFQTALKTIGNAAQNVDLDPTFMELRQKILFQITLSDNVTEAPAQYIKELSEKVSSQVTPTILKEMANAIIKYPLSEQVEQLTGLALAQSGETLKAIGHYRNALVFNPRNPVTYNNMGLCFRKLNQFSKALDAFQQAIEIKNNYFKAHYNIAFTYEETGTFEKAIEYYLCALEILPDFLPARLALANIYTDQGLSTEAKELLTDIDMVNANEPATLVALVNYHNSIGQFGKSERILRDYIDQNGASEVSNIKLITTSVHLNDYKRIIELSLELIRSDRRGFCPFLYLKIGLSLLEHAQPSLLDDAVAQIEKTARKSQLQLQFRALKYDRYCYSLDHKSNFSKEYKKQEKLVLPPSKRKRDLPEDVSYFLQKTQIFALVHCGRSGTGLLHSLIDNHPEISTLPSVYLSEFFHPQTWKHLMRLGQQSLVNEFCALYPVLFDARDPRPIRTVSNIYRARKGNTDGMTSLGEDKKQVQKLDLSEFKNNLTSFVACYENITQIEFFKLIHAAYELVHNGKLQPHKKIFYHIHNPEVVTRINILNQYQSLKWVIVYREPLRSLESWLGRRERKFELFEQYNKILGILDTFYTPIYQRKSTIKLKLEDIKTDPKNTLQGLCKCMGISYHDSLSTMTMQGLRWWGDPASPDYNTDGMLPFGHTSINRKLGQFFSEGDLEFFTNLLSHFSFKLLYTKSFDSTCLDKCLKFIESEKAFDFEARYSSEIGMELASLLSTGGFIYFRHELFKIIQYIKSL